MDIRESKHRTVGVGAALALIAPIHLPHIDDVDVVDRSSAPKYLLEELKDLAAKHRVKLKDGTILQLTPEQYAELELIYRRRRYENKGAARATARPDLAAGDKIMIEDLGVTHRGQVLRVKPSGDLTIAYHGRAGDTLQIVKLEDFGPNIIAPPSPIGSIFRYTVKSSGNGISRLRRIHE